MRQSKRDDILEAAKHVVQREGVTMLTYESVATEAGLTKGGLLYHFPSREALLLALHEYVAAQWEACLEAEGGGTAEQLSPEQRFAAFTRLSQNPDRAELLLMLEAGEDHAANAAWEAVYSRWAPGPPQVDETGDPDDDELRAFVARLAADGLWFCEALAPKPLDEAVRSRVVEAIITLGAGGDAEGDVTPRASTAREGVAE